MPEFRTRDLGEEKADPEDPLERYGKMAWQRIQNDPRLQAQAAIALNQNMGLDEGLLRSVFPDLDAGMDMMEQQYAAQNQVQNGAQEAPDPAREEYEQMKRQKNDGAEPPEPNESDEIHMTKKPNLDDIKDIVDTAIEMLGPNMTLQELRDFIDENPDIVRNQIDIEL